MKWVRAAGLYLVGELGLFVLVKLLFRATWSELVGPYLAFAVPMMIFLLFVWLLRTWENSNPSPRRLALAWGLNVALLASMVDGAFDYSGAAFGIINLRHVSDWGDWGFAVVMSILCGAVVTYQGVYRLARARSS